MQIDTSKIKAIIFDLGDVLIPIDWSESEYCFERLGAELTDQVYDRIIQLDRMNNAGMIEDEQFRQELKKTLGIDYATDKEIDECWCKLVLDYPRESRDLVEALAQRYELYVLSNINNIHYQCIKKFKYWDERPFKKLFLSYQMHTRKPLREIYKKVMEQLPYKKEEIIYFDDVREYVESAKKFIGINAIQIKNDLHEIINQLFNIKIPIEK